MLAQPGNITNIGKEDDWVKFFFTDRDPLCLPSSLTFIITQLPPDNFRLWHKSHIINLKQIDYYWYCGRAIEVLMLNGQKARISKDHTQEFIRIIDDFDNIKWCESEYYVPQA